MSATETAAPFGTLASCGECHKNIGELHFCAPNGIARYFSCWNCGSDNDFVNSAQGIVRLTRPGRKAK
jgi:hypothetical protein